MTWKLTRNRPKPKRRWIVLSTVGVVFTGILSGWLVYGSGAFAVNRVEVRGSTFTDVEAVRAAAGVEKGVSIVSVDADEVAVLVARLPEVERVTVSRDWPHTIVIDITERKPFLAIPEGKDFILVDTKGVAFRTVSDAPAGTFIVKLDKPGRQDPATAAVLTVLSALTPELENLLVKVDAEAATRITLELKDNRTVFWGDASRSDRKAEVATALLTRSEKHFDVSAPDVPTVS